MLRLKRGRKGVGASAVRHFSKKYGILLSDHAADRFVTQKRGKSKRHYSEAELVSVWKQGPNYRESNNRLVKYYNGIAVIYNERDRVIISMVVRKNAKKDWGEI